MHYLSLLCAPVKSTHNGKSLVLSGHFDVKVLNGLDAPESCYFKEKRRMANRINIGAQTGGRLVKW